MPTVRSCSDAVLSYSSTSAGKRARISSISAADTSGTVGRQIDRDAARHDAVHHQPMTEAGGGAAQHAFAQHAAMRQHDAERRIVADRAEVAEVIGDPLQLRHHAAQPDGARRRFDAEGALHGAREGEGIGNRAVARGAAGEPRGAWSSVAPRIRWSMPLCT